jgi:hypothetical protein
LMLCIESKIPEKLFRILTKIDGINLEYYDTNGMNVLNYIIDSKVLKEDIKYNLVEILIANDINLLEANKVDSKPIVVKAVENDLFNIVVLIMNKLINKAEIQVGDDDIIRYIKYGTSNKITVKDTTRPNFYPLVIMYLKQNMHKLNVKKYEDNKRTLIDIIKMQDRNNINIEHCLVKWLFMTMVMILGIIEKHYMKNNSKKLINELP